MIQNGLTTPRALANIEMLIVELQNCAYSACQKWYHQDGAFFQCCRVGKSDQNHAETTQHLQAVCDRYQYMAMSTAALNHFLCYC